MGKVVAIFVALVVCLWIGGCAIGVVGSWGDKEKDIVGADHSDAQVTAVLDDWTNLQASASNYCDAKDSVSGDDDPQLVEKPGLAYAGAYRRTKADYDRRQNNFFEAYQTRHIPIPGGLRGLPKTAPTLREAQDKWC